MANYHNNNNSSYAHIILASTLAEFLGFENPLPTDDKTFPPQTYYPKVLDCL
jgi:hypothetical protein